MKQIQNKTSSRLLTEALSFLILQKKKKKNQETNSNI